MKDGWSRRHVAAAGLASLALPAAAASPIGAATVRPAQSGDAPQMARLLLADARGRAARDLELWPLAAEPEAQIVRHLRRELASEGPSGLWLVAEARGAVVGLSHAILTDGAEGQTPRGVLLDDCSIAAKAPAGAAEALLAATEEALRRAGARDLSASCPAGGAWGQMLARCGYGPAARIMRKARLAAAEPSLGVRRATIQDLPAMVAFWMRAGPERPGQEVFVAGPGGLGGYVVAEAGGRPLPAAHDPGPVGTIEELHAESGLSAALLAAAEGALAERGVGMASATSPWGAAARTRLLEQAGYRTIGISMLKA